MKKVIMIYVMITAFVILGGCASNKELVNVISTSTNQDVFQEIEEKSLPVPGYADLQIYSSLKTHKPGIYSDDDLHGTKDYLLVVNIDGQATQLRGRLNLERCEARSLRDPEEGDGIRYEFTKNLRIKPGPHKIAVAIPSDDLAIEQEINIAEGGIHKLAIEPIYSSTQVNQRPTNYCLTSFMQGIRSMRLLLNGKTI